MHGEIDTTLSIVCECHYFLNSYLQNRKEKDTLFFSLQHEGKKEKRKETLPI